MNTESPLVLHPDILFHLVLHNTHLLVAVIILYFKQWSYIWTFILTSLNFTYFQKVVVLL